MHVSDLSWTEHNEHPADVYKRGDARKQIVLVDTDAKKYLWVSNNTQNPWEHIEKTIQNK